MNLSSSRSSALSQVVALLADATDGDALRAALGEPLLRLLDADHYTSMVWNAHDARFQRFAAVNVSAAGLQAWDAHYRFIDPITFPLMARRRPTRVDEVIAQQDLVHTEFFTDFLRPERMHWGVNAFFFDGDQALGDLRIYRRRGRGVFGDDEVALLTLLEPGITGALARLHWDATAAPSAASTEQAEALLQRALALSTRESQIAWLVACGCPDKQIARRLGVGAPTVRFHLAKVFDKLQVHKRVAVATRVQATLRAHRQGAGG